MLASIRTPSLYLPRRFQTKFLGSPSRSISSISITDWQGYIFPNIGQLVKAITVIITRNIICLPKLLLLRIGSCQSWLSMETIVTVINNSKNNTYLQYFTKIAIISIIFFQLEPNTKTNGTLWQQKLPGAIARPSSTLANIAEVLN